MAMIPVKRPGWQLRLNEALRAGRGRAFAWGEHDCLLWAAECVSAMTGVDPAATWRGRYCTPRGGLARLRALGHESVIAAASAHLGAPRPGRFARYGDIAAVPGLDWPGGDLSLGVSVGRWVLTPGPVRTPEAGYLRRTPIGDARWCWQLLCL